MASKAVIDTLIAEAGGEGEDGLIAAAWAIQQRAAARGQTIDQVVRSGFDGYSKPGSAAVRAQADPAMRARVERIMSGVESGSIPNPVPGADHFLSGNANPSWAKGMKLVATVGGQRFYASGNVPESAQGGSVGTELSVRDAPTPAKPSAVLTASRNKQNMAPAADVAASSKTAVTPYLNRSGGSIMDPASVVFGKEMTTRLPQPVGQSVIERPKVQAAPARVTVSASDKARANPVGKAPATRVVQSVKVAAPAKPVVSASDKARGAVVPAARTAAVVAPPAIATKTNSNIADAKQEQKIVKARGPALDPAKPTPSVIRIAGQPNGSIVANKGLEQLQPNVGLPVDALALAPSAPPPAIKSAALAAITANVKPVKPVVAPVAPRAPVVRQAVAAPVRASAPAPAAVAPAARSQLLTSGGYYYAPNGSGGYTRLGPVDPTITPSQRYAMLNAGNSGPRTAADRAGTSLSQSGGERSFMER